MNSSQYKVLIENYKRIYLQIIGLYDYLFNCVTAVSLCKSSIEDTKIDGDFPDKEKLENISLILEQLRSSFNTVVAECKLKIAMYESLYSTALLTEQKKNESSIGIEV